MSRHEFTFSHQSPYPTDPSMSMDYDEDELTASPTSEFDFNTFNGNIPRPSHEETEQYLRRTLGIPPHIPVNLWALPDGGPRPTLSVMSRLAIWGSPQKRLLLSEIYAAVEARFPQLAALPDKAWRRSMRHNLSMMKMFEQVRRPADYPGPPKSDFWVLNVRHGEARRPKPPKKNRGTTSDSSEEFSSSGSSPSASPQQGFYGLAFQAESPRPVVLPLGPGHPSTVDRFTGRHVDARRGIQGGHVHSVGTSGMMHGYNQEPQIYGINPMLTMGDHSHAAPARPSRHPATDSAARRRTYDHTFGTDEGAKGLPNNTRRSRTT